MRSLEPATYLEHIRSESARFREVLADADPTARVPTCPDWDATDLLWHLTGVNRFWASVIDARPARPEEQEPSRPTSYSAMLEAFDEASRTFQRVLAAADPVDAAWTWSTEQTVGFTYRRQAHEALIHRLDAELTVGEVTAVDTQLAADGIEEALDVMFGQVPSWGTFTPGEGVLRVDANDADWPVWVQLGTFTGTDPDGRTFDEPDISVIEDPGEEPDAVLTGPAAVIDAWLWRRADDAELLVHGERDVFDRFRVIVDQPLN